MGEQSAAMIHDEFLRCRDALLAALSDEMLERPHASGLEWIAKERYAIARAANEWAVAHGGLTVTVDHVERVEMLAEGHIDYASKLALYVAEIVYGYRKAANP